MSIQGVNHKPFRIDEYKQEKKVEFKISNSLSIMINQSFYVHIKFKQNANKET